jgi:hypothetical protein
MALIADILMDYDAKVKREEHLMTLKKEVKALNRKKTILQELESKKRENINSGKTVPLATYRIPLELRDLDVKPNIMLGEDDLLRLPQIARNKEQMTALTYCQGVTVWSVDDETKFIFDPYVGGQPYGPYLLRVRFIQGRMVLRGHSLPHAVETRKLFEEFCRGMRGEGSDQNLSQRISPFISEISRNLRAFLSRQQQCEELREKFGQDLIGMKTTNNFSAVSFSAILDTEGEDSKEQPLVITISMVYKRNAERPKTDSVKVSYSKEIPEEDKKATMERCSAFYSKKLTEALLEAF